MRIKKFKMERIENPDHIEGASRSWKWKKPRNQSLYRVRYTVKWNNEKVDIKVMFFQDSLSSWNYTDGYHHCSGWLRSSVASLEEALERYEKDLKE
jgi:hypothetical protein